MNAATDAVVRVRDPQFETVAENAQPPESQTPTVIGILREYVPEYMRQFKEQISSEVANILARISLCRTEALGRHKFRCDDCPEVGYLYNSCGERGCPLCAGGGRRDDWIERMEPMVLPGLHFYQVVFTLPDIDLSWLLWANREKLFSLIMQAAWKAIKKLMRKLGIQPSATLVLHTWNQRLGFHVHVHVLIPAGGLSLCGEQWIDLKVADLNLTEPDRKAGHVGNQIQLGQWFRKFFIRGIVRLYRRGELKLVGMKCLLFGDKVLRAWLDRIAPNGYGVFVEPPPSVDARPENILNYIGRYVTGGPISDWRIHSSENGIVTFMARSLKRTPGEKTQRVEVKLSGIEFVQRWTQHILPKGFVRSRHYGNFANRNRAEYLQHARKLLGIGQGNEDSHDGELESIPWDPDRLPEDDSPQDDQSSPRCPRCGRPMKRVSIQRRPSWRITMNSKYRPSWYDS